MIEKPLCRAGITMAFHSIGRLAARFAAFSAIAVLLLQASCPAQFMPSAATQAPDTANAGCHETVPPADAPASEHQCCKGTHYPEALLNPLQAFPAPSITTVIDETHFQHALMPSRWDGVLASVSRPPGPRPLRI
jgi:hypothetical protein